jgi:hypothetical protein
VSSKGKPRTARITPEPKLPETSGEQFIVRRFASLAEVEKRFERVATGFYRETAPKGFSKGAQAGLDKLAHPIWELRAAEEGDGYCLIRKREERDVDLRLAGEGTVAAVEAGIVRTAAAKPKYDEGKPVKGPIPEKWKDTLEELKDEPGVESPGGLVRYMQQQKMTPGGKDKCVASVPAKQVDWIVGRMRVDASDAEVVREFRARCARSSASEELTGAVVNYALQAHHHNQELYERVTGRRVARAAGLYALWLGERELVTAGRDIGRLVQAGKELAGGGHWKISELVGVPIPVQERLERQGTDGQYYTDGLEAAGAAAPYVGEMIEEGEVTAAPAGPSLYPDPNQVGPSGMPSGLGTGEIPSAAEQSAQEIEEAWVDPGLKQHLVGVRVLAAKQGQVADAVIVMVRPEEEAVDILFDDGTRDEHVPVELVVIDDAAPMPPEPMVEIEMMEPAPMMEPEPMPMMEPFEMEPMPPMEEAVPLDVTPAEEPPAEAMEQFVDELEDVAEEGLPEDGQAPFDVDLGEEPDVEGEGEAERLDVEPEAEPDEDEENEEQPGQVS